MRLKFSFFTWFEIFYCENFFFFLGRTQAPVIFVRTGPGRISAPASSLARILCMLPRGLPSSVPPPSCQIPPSLCLVWFLFQEALAAQPPWASPSASLSLLLFLMLLVTTHVPMSTLSDPLCIPFLQDSLRSSELEGTFITFFFTFPISIFPPLPWLYWRPRSSLNTLHFHPFLWLKRPPFSLQMVSGSKNNINVIDQREIQRLWVGLTTLPKPLPRSHQYEVKWPDSWPWTPPLIPEMTY